MSGRYFFNDAQQQDKEQWPQTKIQDPYQHVEELLYIEGGRALEQAALGSHGVFLPGDIQSSAGHVPVSPALPAGELHLICRGHFQP